MFNLVLNVKASRGKKNLRIHDIRKVSQLRLGLNLRCGRIKLHNGVLRR